MHGVVRDLLPLGVPVRQCRSLVVPVRACAAAILPTEAQQPDRRRSVVSTVGQTCTHRAGTGADALLFGAQALSLVAGQPAMVLSASPADHAHRQDDRRLRVANQEIREDFAGYGYRRVTKALVRAVTSLLSCTPDGRPDEYTVDRSHPWQATSNRHLRSLPGG